MDALNDCLTRLGNTQVEYIKTTGRGLHSWNLADPEDLALWVNKVVEGTR